MLFWTFYLTNGRKTRWDQMQGEQVDFAVTVLSVGWWLCENSSYFTNSSSTIKTKEIMAVPYVSCCDEYGLSWVWVCTPKPTHSQYHPILQATYIPWITQVAHTHMLVIISSSNIHFNDWVTYVSFMSSSISSDYREIATVLSRWIFSTLPCRLRCT